MNQDPKNASGTKDRGAWHPAAKAAVSFAAGLAVALVLNFLAYRAGLPSKPFIYVAF